MRREIYRLSSEEKEIIQGITSYLSAKLDYSELKELIEYLRENKLGLQGYDYIEFSGYEFRIIPCNEIDAIYYDSTIELIKDCYDLSENKIPSFIEIDWDKTVENCKVDGYGHHFSSYDGGEWETKNYWIFRTN